MKSSVLSTAMLLVTAATIAAQQPADPPPIIDMHLHAQNLWTEPGAPEPLTGLPAAASSEELQRSTLAALERHNIVTAVASGGLAERYRAAAPDRILASPLLTDASVSPDSLRVWFESDRYQALAEFAPQYAGLAPDDPALEPYFALAEELDVPVGIHMGLGAPGAAYGGTPAYRMAHSDPLLLEDVLVRHPDLRLYVMHAGWPMLDEMVGLLYAHPQVYVDIAVINWALPRAEFHAYLRRLVEAGFGERIMFGSDQMVWPDAIGRAIEGVESADFLSREQKRDIFYDNAARFLRLDSSTSGRADERL